MARVSWFDEETDLPIVHEQARNLESFVEAMADGQVERRELEQQQERLIGAMRGVERELTDAQQEKVTRLLLE